MSKQTAVEWLEEPLLNILTHQQQMQVIGLFHQALAMEKEQMKDAVLDDVLNENMKKKFAERFEQYYNETYGN